MPVVPCRLFDTRAAAPIGPRNTPLAAQETYTQAVTGTNGDCTIPSDANAIAMNVTIVNPTDQSFLTIWPADAPQPLASNLNWIATSPPTPNKVDVQLSADGRLKLFSNAGSVDVLADVVGYYVDHNFDDRYYTEAEIDAKLAAIVTQPGPPGQTGAAGRGLERPVDSVTPIDVEGVAGVDASVAIGIDGLPVVAYGQNDVPRSLEVAHCRDVACTTFDPPTTIDSSSAIVGRGSSLAIAPSGFPVISYVDTTNGDLKFVRCLSVTCADFSQPIVLDPQNVSSTTALAIGVDGLPMIAYYDAGQNDLRGIHCSTADCSTFDATTLAAPSLTDVGLEPAIAIGNDGFAIITSYNNSTFDLDVLHCTNVPCTTHDAYDMIDNVGNVGRKSSITIGVDGFAVVSYMETVTGNEARIAHCRELSCDTADLDTLGPLGIADTTSITIGPFGYPVVTATSLTNAPAQFFHCSDIVCSESTARLLDAPIPNLALRADVVIGVDGLPLIMGLSQAGAGSDLVAIHCSNDACLPNVRRD